MSGILKFVLLALGATLILLLVFGLVLLLAWPWWVSFFLLLGVMALFVGGLFVQKLWARRRERSFVQKVIEQDESLLRKASDKEKGELKELQNRWKESLEILRRSHLRKRGNPLYVLPWYLVMGESGSGKTTALSSASLSSPFVEVHKASGISGTRNCDWWFFEQAVVLDTAGRYAIPVDQGRDKEEWQRFLRLLVKYRKREPINGLIITVAADRVVQDTGDALEEEGRTIRRRMDELMRVLGAKFPVYLLITKCDLIQGMTHFCDRLPEKSLEQPMGVINQELSEESAAFVDRAMSSIGERLRNLRLLLLHEPKAKREDSAFFVFPEEFENLKQGLHAFVRGAFCASLFQDLDTPVLRGLFFSSGRQEGTPYSHFLGALGLIGQKEVLPGTSRGLFLHDFFAKVLPSDRSLLAPTRRARQWQILTRNLGLTSWIILGLALSGLMSFSFVKNLRVIRQVPDEFVRPLSLQGVTWADLITMDRFAQAIFTLEARNEDWWIPRFGLNESDEVEERLKERYCRQYKEVFLSSLDQRMADVLTDVTPATPDGTVGEYASHLVKRIRLLKARLEGQDLEALREEARFSWAPLLSSQERALEADHKDTLGSLYLSYLLWLPDEIEIRTQMDAVQAWLRHLLAQKQGNLRWLVAWTNQNGSIPAITLEEFWGDSGLQPTGKSIDPAFTRKGRELIESFLAEMELAFPDPKVLSQQKAEFEKWFRLECIEAWRTFAVECSNGSQRLKDRNQWQEMATRVTTDQGPYFALLLRMAIELGFMADTDGLPPWLQQTYQFEVLKADAAAGGVLQGTAQAGRKIISTLQKAVGRTPGERGQALGESFEAYKEYRSALDEIASVATSAKRAHQLTSLAFSGEDSDAAPSPFQLVEKSASKLYAALGGNERADDVFWRLMIGPLSYLWNYATRETACYLQSQWEDTVLAEVRGASEKQQAQLLFGEDGLAWRFVRGKGLAAPFLSRGLKGYSPAVATLMKPMKTQIPFDSSFCSFLDRGAKVKIQEISSEPSQEYSVLIKGLPTDANPEARQRPHATRLELKCEGGASQTLVNLNYPVSKTFVWTQESCSDVILKIEVSDIVLVKRYPGPRGFPSFLRQFQDGKGVFSSVDFTAEKAALGELGITKITVRYQFRGAGAILRQPAPVSVSAPEIIAHCWEP